jgi:hypothetical protein
MPDEDQLFLRQAKPPPAGIDEDTYRISDDLDFIMSQLARLPTRREMALKPLYIMFGSAALVILWIELFRRVCL